MANTLVLGIGNLLMSDDGVGIHAVKKLIELVNNPEVQIIDGGTSGLDLMQYLDGVKKLIILDAVKAGKPPGTILRYSGDQVPAYLSLKISPHEIGLPELLFAAKLRDIYPPQVVILGIQPEILELGVELSLAVANQLDELVQKVITELNLTQSSID